MVKLDRIAYQSRDILIARIGLELTAKECQCEVSQGLAIGGHVSSNFDPTVSDQQSIGC